MTAAGRALRLVAEDEVRLEVRLWGGREEAIGDAGMTEGEVE